MTEVSVPLPSSTSRFDFKQLGTFLFRTRAGIARLASAEKPVWLLPMLAVTLLFIVRTVVSGYFQARAAAMGNVQLPVDWQWWSPEMQQNYMQAQQATQGPVFVYIIPLTLGLVKFWAAWLIVGGLTHLSSTLFGGRGKMVSALNVTAWACLPFVLRDLLRIIFMLIEKHSIASPGLSGLVTSVFLMKLLGSLDLFFLWFAVLLVFGISKVDKLSLGKAAAGVAIVLVVALLAQAGLGTLAASLGNMTITRGF